MGKVISVVPARGGSKGIPRKNLRILGDKPLIAHQIDSSLQAELVDETIVSTDDSEIAEAAKEYGAEVPFRRPKRLGADDVPVIDVIKHSLKKVEQRAEIDYILCLQPTSPFTTSDQINEAVETARMTECDSVVAVEPITETHPYRAYRLEGDKVLPIEDITREAPVQRQDRPDAYGFTGAIYVRTPKILHEWDRSDFALGDDVRAVVQQGMSAVEIDTPFQLRTARALLAYDQSSNKEYWSR